MAAFVGMTLQQWNTLLQGNALLTKKGNAFVVSKVLERGTEDTASLLELVKIVDQDQPTPSPFRSRNYNQYELWSDRDELSPYLIKELEIGKSYWFCLNQYLEPCSGTVQAKVEDADGWHVVLDDGTIIRDSELWSDEEEAGDCGLIFDTRQEACNALIKIIQRFRDDVVFRAEEVAS